MRVKNTTGFTTETVREMIRYCKDLHVHGNFEIQIKNSKHRGVCGRAFIRGCGYHATANPFINIRIGHENYPRQEKREYCKGKAYLPALYLSQEEEIMHVIAHELRHFWQAKHPKGWRVWGAKGKYSERDADAYAIRKTREGRRLNGTKK